MEAYIHETVVRGDTFTVAFSGCNFKCRFCNTPHLVEFRTDERMQIRDVKAMLDAAGARRIVFTGGEPLLQRQALLDLAAHAKKRGYQVVIETNASKPDGLKTLLDEHLVDELQVDLKGPWPTFENVTRAGTFFQPAAELYEDLQRSLTLLRQHDDVAVRFKTVITPGLLYRKEDILAIGKLLKGFETEWLLVPFNPSLTLDPTLRGVAPPTARFLETLATFAQEANPKLRLRVEEGGVASGGS